VVQNLGYWEKALHQIRKIRRKMRHKLINKKYVVKYSFFLPNLFSFIPLGKLKALGGIRYYKKT